METVNPRLEKEDNIRRLERIIDRGAGYTTKLLNGGYHTITSADVSRAYTTLDNLKNGKQVCRTCGRQFSP